MYGRRIHRLTSAPALLLVVLAEAIACSASRPPTRSELSPGVVFTHHIAEGTGDGFGPEPPRPSATPALQGEAGAPNEPAPAAPPPSASPSSKPLEGPPDPDPLRLSDQWEYELSFDAGKVAVVAARARHFDKPVVSARRIGRFAIELWIGRELVERIRFDFPGLGLEARPAEQGTRRPLFPPANFAQGVHSRQTVLVPAAPRARRALLVDRATGESQELPWPPDHPWNQPAQTPP
ncbi:MAG TPA: hypothetical protein VFQ35_25210 [Polyangiaceae bacterium]|nr:hypothetical protein [Polyangiaceae bacterium]